MPLVITDDERKAVTDVMRDICRSMKARSFIRPIIRQDVSNKRWAIGYEWARAGSSMISGRVYDVTVARADTLAEALAKAKAKVK